MFFFKQKTAYEMRISDWSSDVCSSDLYAASDDEARVLPIQSKALSKRAPVPLGGSLDRLCSHWWVVTINANTASPTCFVLTLDEVKAAAHRGVNQAGTASYWLQPKSYALEE